MGLFDWTKFAGLCAAIFFGSGTLGATSWVWFKHQVLGWPGGTLAFVGATLIGLAVWTDITVEAGPLKAQFAELKQELANVKHDVA